MQDMLDGESDSDDEDEDDSSEEEEEATPKKVTHCRFWCLCGRAALLMFRRRKWISHLENEKWDSAILSKKYWI